MTFRLEGAPLRALLCCALCALLPLLAPSTADAGIPFVTDDPGTPEAGHYEMNIATQYTHRRGEDSGVLPSFELNYGATDNVQLHFLAGLAFDRQSPNGAHFGSGDVELGVKYRFIQAEEQGWIPDVAFVPALDLPAGDRRHALGTGHAHAFLPLTIGRDFAPWSAFGEVGYAVNPGAGNRDWWFVGGGLTRDLGNGFTLGAELFHTSVTQTGGKPNTAFNVGGIYEVAEGHRLLLSAGRSLENAAENSEFSLFLAYQHTF
jgi:hypothetical protein